MLLIFAGHPPQKKGRKEKRGIERKNFSVSVSDSCYTGNEKANETVHVNDLERH